MTHPAIASLSEFATILGVKPSYVTALKKDGRLVLTDDGKRVRVAESRERIEATKDPAKHGVASRHAAARAQAAQEDLRKYQEAEEVAARIRAVAKLANVEVPDAIWQDPESTLPADDSHAVRRSRALADKAEQDAITAKRENLKAEGKLLDAADVASAIGAGIVTLRTRLEALPDTLAPALVVVNDEKRARAIIAGEIEQALNELARKFGGIAKEAA